MAEENFYYGTTYPLSPESGEIVSDYSIAASQIGMATDPRTANQLIESSNKVNPGGIPMEISTISPQIFESIPEPHLEEIKRLSKLTGTELSVHGPAVEPSGYTEQGWSEANRQFAENQMSSAVERSHKLDPEGNIPVTFHPAYTLPEAELKVKEKVEGKYKEVPKSVLIVDSRTGEVRQIKREEKYFPEIGRKEFKPSLEIEKRNDELWTRALNDLNFYAMRGEDLVTEAMTRPERSMRETGLSEEEIEEGKKKLPVFMKMYSEGEEEKLPQDMQKVFSGMSRELDHANIFLRDSYNMLRELYNRVYKEADEKEKAKLDAYAKEIQSQAEAGIEKNPEKMKEFADIIERGVKVLGKIKSPKLYQHLNKFLTDKDSETFSNIALKSYKKFGDKAPIVSIENPPAGTAISRGKDIKELIEETRNKFVEKATKEGMSKSQAERAAEKLIGATWDVGHINMLRKYGYDKTDITKETEKIAPFIKHVHLSDNFGYEHTELPMGMGTVPFKDIMKKLGKKGEKVRKIIEAAQWYQFFQKPPLVETYETANTPLFPMKAPYWSQIAATQGSYFAFPLSYVPEQHISIYGLPGFSGLPQELGGQIPGKQARFGGTPTA